MILKLRLPSAARAFAAAMLAAAAALLPPLSAARAEAGPGHFEKLERVRFLQNESNDGDSFHVSAGGKEFIFRLYHVDTPETDARFPERVKEQAEYFGLTVEETIKVGKIAEEFTRGKLAAKPFTVFTSWEDARGSSRLPRYYAWIVVEDKTLQELLVANGLARVFGMPGNPPSGMSSAAFKAHLKVLEEKARQDHLGAWAVRTPSGGGSGGSGGGDAAWDKFFAHPSPGATPR